LDNIIEKYVKKVKSVVFVVILYSWGGQTNPPLYDEKFVDKNDKPNCSLNMIPPKCTPPCQPCDEYFYREVKKLHHKISELPSTHSS
jgi:hypothetical protein